MLSNDYTGVWDFWWLQNITLGLIGSLLMQITPASDKAVQDFYLGLIHFSIDTQDGDDKAILLS